MISSNTHKVLSYIICALAVIILASVIQKANSGRNPYGAYQPSATARVHCIEGYMTYILRVEGEVYLRPVRRHNGFMNAPLTCEQWIKEKL